MDYEMDFIGVSKEKAAKDAEAICFRWKHGDSYKIAVYDVGWKPYGDAIVKHLNEYYFHDKYNKCNRYEKRIDYLFISHPHQDHVAGIDSLIENFDVAEIYMNRPWLYADQLECIYSNDGRVTSNSIENELYNDFPFIKHIEDLANKYSIEIKEAFQGKLIGNRLWLLSPDKEFYLEKIASSTKTKRLTEESTSETATFKSQSSGTLKETWYDEQLREGETTDAENETSLVVLGDMDEEKFLLAGDAGNEALDNSIEFAFTNGVDLAMEVKIYSMPHHGGRHNVSPSLLNKLIGPIRSEDVIARKLAIASVAEGSDHPKKMVVNAFKRRGVKVYITAGSIHWHHHGNMPKRARFSRAEELPFYHDVEAF